MCQWSGDYPSQQAAQIAKRAHEQSTGHQGVSVVSQITEGDTSTDRLSARNLSRPQNRAASRKSHHRRPVVLNGRGAADDGHAIAIENDSQPRPGLDADHIVGPGLDHKDLVDSTHTTTYPALSASASTKYGPGFAQRASELGIS